MLPLTSPLLLIAISIASFAPHSLTGAATTRAHRLDPRELPSPLPANRTRHSNNMNAELSPMKRSAGTNGANESQANSTTRSSEKKRFKTSGKVFESSHSMASSSSSSASNINQSATANSTRTRQVWRDDNDLNNNSIPSDDNNNNNNNNLVQPVWRRNVDSVNGTVDLSQYERNDIDRLYGDALLVYFKNFNESLPARRELVSINGTISSAPLGSRNRIPIYRSVPTNEPK